MFQKIADIQIRPRNSYYKFRIIFTFVAVTVGLVILMSQLSYIFIRKIYLEQVEEQVLSSIKSISKQIEKPYLNILDLGLPTQSTSEYFIKLFRNNLSGDLTNAAFLFDSAFTVYVHSEADFTSGRENSQLMLFKDEIVSLNPGKAIVTSLFKGDDDQWYLLSFYRLNKNFWLAVRESAHRLQKVDDIAKIFWIIGIGGTLLAIITGWFLSRSITQPLDKLVNFSNQIGRGDFNSEPPKNLRGEIKVLADAMLQMKNDLSSNQKEKENMLAQIAHEIRNPLGGIELLTNLSKEDLAKGQVKEEYLNKILSEIHGLKSLITSFLNYSRPSPSVPSHTSIPQVINEVKNIFQNDMNRKNIQLKLEIETPSVWFDDNHLKQVIINLFSNAVEAANFNSEIAIKSFINNSCNYISISNSGIVIPQENIGKIFNPFFTTKKEGTGLGLAICKKLCSENNANLYVESSHEHGTKFTIVKEINNEQ